MVKQETMHQAYVRKQAQHSMSIISALADRAGRYMSLADIAKIERQCKIHLADIGRARAAKAYLCCPASERPDTDRVCCHKCATKIIHDFGQGITDLWETPNWRCAFCGVAGVSAAKVSKTVADT